MGDLPELLDVGRALGTGTIGFSRQPARAAEAVPTDIPKAPVIRWSAIVVLAAVAMAVLGGGQLRGAVAPAEVAAVAVAAVAAVSVRALDRAEAKWLVAVGLFTAFWTVAALGWGTGLDGARGLGLGAVAFAAVMVVARRIPPSLGASAPRLVAYAVVAISGWSLVMYVARVVRWAEPAQGVWRAGGPMTYANGFGLLLALTIPMLLDTDRGAPPAVRRWARLALFLALTALVVSMSRTSLVALGAGLVVSPPAMRRRIVWPCLLSLVVALPLLATATSPSPSPLILVPLVVGALLTFCADGPRLERGAAVGAAVLALGGLALGGLAVAGHSGISEVMSARTAPGNLDTRSPEWRAGLRQARDAPIVGVGPEQSLMLVDPRDGHEYWTRFVHSEVLQVAAGGGLVGLGLLVLMSSALVAVLRCSRAPHIAPTALVLLVGGLLDFSWHLPSIAMAAGLLLGLDPTRKVDKS